MDPRIRQLTIKTGVVRRLAKEKVVYEKEAQTNRDRIEKFKREGKDDHVIRKEEECLQETLMMVPDCQRRLAKAYEELNDFLKAEIELKQSKEYEAAVAVMDVAKLQLP